jgi:hypothetical protein
MVEGFYELLNLFLSFDKGDMLLKRNRPIEYFNILEEETVSCQPLELSTYAVDNSNVKFGVDLSSILEN